MTLGARILCFVIRERAMYRHEIIGVTLYAAALIVAEAYGYGYLTVMQPCQRIARLAAATALALRG